MSSGGGSALRYIPKHKRRQQRQQADRLHGAFAGGFSAGYFNTVGSREGWQPQNNIDEVDNGDDKDDDNRDRSRLKRKHQSVEDFMDEQDFNDFAGPSRVRRDLVAVAANEHDDEEVQKGFVFASKDKRRSILDEEKSLLDVALSTSSAAVVTPKNLGQQLLKELGWRGGTGKSSHAYVELKDPRTATTKQNDNCHTHNHEPNSDERLFLSKRRLQKIKIQQSQISIPPPKLDTVGLGFEAHANAPEFKAYFEKRQRERRQAKEKDQRIYKLGKQLLGEEDENDGSIGHNHQLGRHDVDESYLEHETAMDFVGTRSASGFALREEDDDAFDDDQNAKRVSKKVRINCDEYDTIIQDIDDDDECSEQGNKANRPTSQSTKEEKLALGGALTDWVQSSEKSEEVVGGATSVDQRNKTSRLALDGRPVLEGFVPSLLASVGTEAWNQRFRGPDLPPNFVITRHQFAKHENPMVLKALARAEQLELDDARRQSWIPRAMESSADASASSHRHVSNHSFPEKTEGTGRPYLGRIGSNVFKELAQSMKDRFTSPTTASTSVFPAEMGAETTKKETSKTRDPTIVTLTTQLFQPAPLLCKRFHVPVPQKLGTAAARTTIDDNRRLEERFFQDKVLKAVEASHSEPKEKLSEIQQPTEDNVVLATKEAEAKVEVRPPMEFYRSIFATQESGEDSSESCDEQDKLMQDKTNPQSVTGSSTKKSSLVRTDDGAKNDDEIRSNTVKPPEQRAISSAMAKNEFGVTYDDKMGRGWSSDSSFQDDKEKGARKRVLGTKQGERDDDDNCSERGLIASPDRPKSIHRKRKDRKRKKRRKDEYGRSRSVQKSKDEKNSEIRSRKEKSSKRSKKHKGSGSR